MNRKFKTGEYVIHKSHGMGVIKSIESRDLGNGKTDFYVMEIMDLGCTKKVFIGVNDAENKLRYPINSQEVPDIYGILENTKAEDDHSSWNRKYRDYMEKIQTGDLQSITEIVRDFIELAKNKELSFGEKMLFQAARNKLVKELALVEGLTEKQVEDRLKKMPISRNNV